MDVYNEIATKIIERQEAVMGPIAVEQAKSVSGLEVDWPHRKVKIVGDSSKVIDGLVEVYKALFGQISVEVCKEAVGRLAQQLSPEQMPASLR